ncbi:hypothetical protein [Nitrosospira briensis]|uniref:hypothetical protein n=1 Tax=Nitrosospira briensis TaxID=35799 RepID=UPI0011605467|nr:hypothetical protein [Nitrosospira briensis]
MKHPTTGASRRLGKRGRRAKLETCGEQRRLCVRIDKTTGCGKDGDYFVLRVPVMRRRRKPTSSSPRHVT